jgi:hypothetical protein
LSEQTTDAQLRDLAAAVIEALTVPYAKHPADEHKAASLMRSRAAIVRGGLSVVAEGIARPQYAAAAIRTDIAAYPVTYDPYVAEGVEQPSLGVVSLPAAWSAAAVAS